LVSALNNQERERIRLQNYVSDWSEKVVEHATIDDLFVGAISEAPSNQLAYLLVQEEFATSTPVFPQH
jgi:hypothetical protein